MLTINKKLNTPEFLYYSLKILTLFKGNPFLSLKNFYSLKVMFLFLMSKPFRFFRFEKFNKFFFKQLSTIKVWPFKAAEMSVSIYGLVRRSVIYSSLRCYYKLKQTKNLLKRLKSIKSWVPAGKVFNYLKYINFTRLLPAVNSQKPFFSLRRRVFLNKKLIKKSLIYFFYKKVKFKLTKTDTKKTLLKKCLTIKSTTTSKMLFPRKTIGKVILVNFNKKLYWKIRKSRITHWDSLVGNRLNKYRYVKFIKKTMRIKKLTSPNNFLILFIAHLSGILCSWRQIYLLITYQLIVVNGKFYPTINYLKKGDIVEVCYGRGLRLNFRIWTYFNFKIYYRLKRWSYRNKLNFDLPKRKRIFKKIPKSIKSLLLAHKTHSKAFMYLKSLGLAAVIYMIPRHLYEPQIDFYQTTILKLNNWRYKF